MRSVLDYQKIPVHSDCDWMLHILNFCMQFEYAQEFSSGTYDKELSFIAVSFLAVTSLS